MAEIDGADREAKAAMPLAWVEPHRFLLRQPEPGALLFKIVRVRYLIDMLQQGYLHFQRVDAYGDDTSDGEQLPLDRTTGAGMSFTRDPQFTAERYYDTARERTYTASRRSRSCVLRCSSSVRPTTRSG